MLRDMMAGIHNDEHCAKYCKDYESMYKNRINCAFLTDHQKISELLRKKE